MKSPTHSINDSSSGEVVALVPPPEPPEHCSHGVGVGCAPPGCSDGPSADAGIEASVSAKMSAAVRSDLRKVDSPNAEVVSAVDGQRPARITVEYTPCPQSDTELFCAFVRAGKFAEATSLCNERLLNAANALATLQWTKDAAIVKRAEGRPSDALTLAASVYHLAERVQGPLRGKYENGFGLTLARLGRSYEALERYDLAIYHHTEPVMIGQVLNNKGRLLTTEGAPQDSFKHFERALKAAREAKDILLEAEILESVALAFESLGNNKGARAAALQSVEMLEGTGDVLALEESKATLNRLILRVRA